MLAPLRSNNQRLLGCAWTTNRTPIGFLKLCVPLKAVNEAKELAIAKSIYLAPSPRILADEPPTGSTVAFKPACFWMISPAPMAMV